MSKSDEDEEEIDEELDDSHEGGCQDPAQCIMPDEHMLSECHTGEMLMAQERESLEKEIESVKARLCAYNRALTEVMEAEGSKIIQQDEIIIFCPACSLCVNQFAHDRECYFYWIKKALELSLPCQHEARLSAAETENEALKHRLGGLLSEDEKKRDFLDVARAEAWRMTERALAAEKVIERIELEHFQCRQIANPCQICGKIAGYRKDWPR